MDSNSTSNTSAVPIIAKANAVTFLHPLSIKLDDNNYLLWHLQILTVVHKHELENFLAKAEFIPNRFDSTKDRIAR